MAPKYPANFEEASSFLDFIHEGDQPTFQWYDDGSNNVQAGHVMCNFEQIAKRLETINNEGGGIYYMVNRGDGLGRGKDNVLGVRALFADVDGTPIEPIYNSPLEPHILLQSGPANYHAYWLVEDCELARFTQLQLAIAARFGSDSSVSDECRVMRVPGFWNMKPKYAKPFQVKVLRMDAFLPYKLGTIIDKLELEKYEKEVEKKLKEPLPDLNGLQPKSIQPGERHTTLQRYAIRHAALGYSRGEVLAFVNGINHTYCTEPKQLEEVIRLVDYAIQKKRLNVDLTEFLKKLEEQSIPTDVFKGEEEKEELGPSAFALPEEMLTSAPGLVGELANWVTETNTYWQPSYSLAAALAFVGVLKGHRVRTQENGRTNLLTIAVGSSTSGKTNPLKRMQSLAAAAGMQHILCGNPASEAAVVKALFDAGDKSIILWDEIGLAFKKMFASNAPGYQAGIVRLLLQLYSMSDSVFIGNQYANHDDKRPRIDLTEPCLCVYGTSTKDGIYSAFSSVEAVNGFAARLLIFECHDYLADRQPIGDTSPPDDLVAKVAAFAPVGNLAEIRKIHRPEIRTIPYGPAARTLFVNASRHFESLKRKAIIAKREAEVSIWGRAYEQATKVALTVEDDTIISEESAAWAIELVTALCKNMVVACREQIADNQTHAEVNSVLRLIREVHPQWVDHTYVSKKTRSLHPKRRKELLASLIEEGSIEAKEVSNGGRPKTLFRYVG